MSFGAVEVGNKKNTFYATLGLLPKSIINPEALAVTGFTEAQIAEFPDPKIAMTDFLAWVNEIKERTGNAMLVTDNPYFDAAFLSYYFWVFTDGNPFGHSSLSLTSLFKGWAKTNKASFKHLRDTKHQHHSLLDALGNAEAFEKLIAMGYKT